ncbi:MAG: hypothetical protein K1X92_17810 [Bacteroidia bacterium]|nr:hypothetical protein [Bacteroidia bacterium]
MTTADSQRIIEVIRSAGSVKAEKGDFNQIIFSFHPDSGMYSMERKYWQSETGQVVFENKSLSEGDLQALIEALYSSEEDFIADFGV